MLYSSHPRVSSTNSIFPVTRKPHSNRATRREGEGGTVNESIKGGMGSVGRGTTSRFPLYHPVSTLLYLEFRVGPVSSSYPPLLLSPHSPCNPNKTRDLSYVVYTLIPLSFVLLLYSRIFIFTLRLVINFFPEFSKTLLNESIECDHDRSCHVTRLLQFLDYRKIDRSLLVLLFVNKIHCIQCNSLRIIN